MKANTLFRHHRHHREGPQPVLAGIIAIGYIGQGGELFQLGPRLN